MTLILNPRRVQRLAHQLSLQLMSGSTALSFRRCVFLVFLEQCDELKRDVLSTTLWVEHTTHHKQFTISVTAKLLHRVHKSSDVLERGSANLHSHNDSTFFFNEPAWRAKIENVGNTIRSNESFVPCFVVLQHLDNQLVITRGICLYNHVALLVSSTHPWSFLHCARFYLSLKSICFSLCYRWPQNFTARLIVVPATDVCQFQSPAAFPELVYAKVSKQRRERPCLF